MGEATDGEEACELYDQLFPDVLMLDLRMPLSGGEKVVDSGSQKDPSFWVWRGGVPELGSTNAGAATTTYSSRELF